MNTTHLFHIVTSPAADGAVHSVISPEGTCVWRTDDATEAIAERDRRNAPLLADLPGVEVTA